MSTIEYKNFTYYYFKDLLTTVTLASFKYKTKVYIYLHKPFTSVPKVIRFFDTVFKVYCENNINYYTAYQNIVRDNLSLETIKEILTSNNFEYEIDDIGLTLKVSN